MSRWREISWRQAAAVGALWAAGAVSAVAAILLAQPSGAVAVSIAEAVMLGIVIGAPVVAGLVHRAWKVSVVAAGYLAGLAAVITVVILINLPRDDPDQRYQRLRKERGGLPGGRSP